MRNSKIPTVSRHTVEQLLNSDQLIAFKDAPKEFPRGARVDLSTLHRYRTRGSGGVKLRAIRIGGRWFTDRESIQEFVFDRSNA
ncbi:MAG: DUF1580 domain-containing protein [Rubripirellula sp.]